MLLVAMTIWTTVLEYHKEHFKIGAQVVICQHYHVHFILSGPIKTILVSICSSDLLFCKLVRYVNINEALLA